ncbi:hypothetical protein [Helicobacter salomonis]|uniref:hypothetical protein n=1 Tax=Helicobacter salomonis TaxID=56878 RepID=UPI0018F800E1|nr:hypothetical protein [Helicobacter salomonis]
MKKHAVWPWFVIPTFLAVFLLSFWFIARTQHTSPNSASFPLEKEAFYQAAQSLYDSMLNAHKEASENARCGGGADPDYDSIEMIKRHAKTWIKLATQMVDALPTIKQIQASLPKALATRIRNFEILHALSLVRAKIPDVDCYGDRRPPDYDAVDKYFDSFTPYALKKEEFLQAYSTSLKLVYALLIQSAQQGLDISAYLRFLEDKPDNTPLELRDAGNYDMDASKNPLVIAQLKALYFSTNSYLFFTDTMSGLGHYSAEAYYKEIYKPLNLDLEFTRALNQYYMSVLWRVYGVAKLFNQAQPLEQTLKNFPHICFNATLSKEMETACRGVLARPNAPLQDYLRNFRLIGFDNQPCLYLTSQNTLKTFRSKNPLCRVLQAHPPNMGAPLSKDLILAFQNAQDFLKNTAPTRDAQNLQEWLPTAKSYFNAILQATPLASLQGSKWAYLLDYESLHLLALLEGELADSDQFNDLKFYFTNTPAPLLAQDYARLLDFIYTPLIQASKQGLDPSFYLKNLQDSQFHAIHPCATKDYCTLPPDIPPSAWLEDFKSADLAMDFAAHSGSFGLDWFNADTWYKSLSVSQQQAFKLWDLHYKKRVEAFFYAKDYYVDTLKHPERLSAMYLRANPTPCFYPKYLSPKSAQNCQQILKAQSFNPFRYREYLRSFMLLGIDNSPCLYLNAKEELRGFDSKNPSCKALQAWALYTPPKEIALPPLFLQHVEAMRTLLESALQEAHTQDPTCQQDRTQFLQGVLPQLEQQAQSALESLPLFSNFKPNNDKEKALLKRMQQQAMFLLFALLEGGSEDTCQKNTPTSTETITQNLIRALNFLYQPLIRAHAQGLDAVWYVHTLAHIQDLKHCGGCGDLGKRVQDFIDRRYNAGNTYDGRIAYTIYQDFDIVSLVYDLIMSKSNPHLGYNLLNTLKIARTHALQQNDSKKEDRIFIFSWDKDGDGDMHFLGSTNQNGNQALDLSKEGISTMMDKQKPLRPMNFFALRRVAQFLDAQEALSVDQGDDVYNTPIFFPRYPSACLRLEYLRESTQTECAQMFRSEKYDVSALKAYLQDYIMVSLQGVPCLYLDEQKQVNGLGSASRLCQSLLKPLSKKGWFYHDEGH